MRGVRTGGGEDRVLPYISHIGMCRPKGEDFRPFWSKNTFCSFWPGFEGTTGTTGAYMYLSFQFQMNKNESK